MWRGQHSSVQVQAARIVCVVGGGGSRREPVTRPTGSVERGANATERDTLVGHGCVEGLATPACTANVPPTAAAGASIPPAAASAERPQAAAAVATASRGVGGRVVVAQASQGWWFVHVCAVGFWSRSVAALKQRDTWGFSSCVAFALFSLKKMPFRPEAGGTPVIVQREGHVSGCVSGVAGVLGGRRAFRPSARVSSLMVYGGNGEARYIAVGESFCVFGLACLSLLDFDVVSLVFVALCVCVSHIYQQEEKGERRRCNTGVVLRVLPGYL